MQNKYTVYALISQKDGNLYIGLTSDLEKRVERHNRGYEKATRNRRPFVLVYKEELPNRQEARKREKFLKSGCGREYLKSIMPLV